MKKGLVVVDFDRLGNHHDLDFLMPIDVPIVRLDPKDMGRYSGIIKPQDRKPLYEVVNHITSKYIEGGAPVVYLGGSAVYSQLDGSRHPNYKDLDLLVVGAGSRDDVCGTSMLGLVRNLHRSATENEPFLVYGWGKGAIPIFADMKKAKKYMGMNLWERYDLTPEKNGASTIDLCVANYQSFLDKLKRF